MSLIFAIYVVINEDGINCFGFNKRTCQNVSSKKLNDVLLKAEMACTKVNVLV